MVMTTMIRILLYTLSIFVLVVSGLFLFVFFSSRPEMMTDPAALAADGSLINYCELPVLDGRGKQAVDIPKGNTPGCSYDHFPGPILAECTEPMVEGANDLRGLWQAVSGRTGHVERIEQCGSRTVVTSSGVIHDYGPNSTAGLNTDDTEGGVRFRIGNTTYCPRTSASMVWNDGVLDFHALGWGPVVVRRYMNGEQLVWEYVDGSVTRMERLCQLPELHKIPKRHVLRTPEERFDNLADYPWQPNYMEIDGLRVHFLDEGPRDAPAILLIHGEPTWSYLFRKMIPVLTAAGHRVIAPDLIGFGKSDKLRAEADYSYELHVEVMTELVQRLDLREATFFGQDWGGLIGLRVVGREPDRFARVVVSNTGLPAAPVIGSWFGYPFFKALIWWLGDISIAELKTEISFPRWVAYSYHIEDLPVGEVMRFLGAEDEVVAAYEAPFPNQDYKAAVQVMPYLVPSQLGENERIWREIYENWGKPFLIAFTDSDPITRGGEQAFIDRIPGATSLTIKGAGHFVQEDAGPELAELIDDFIAGRAVKGF